MNGRSSLSLHSVLIVFTSLVLLLCFIKLLWTVIYITVGTSTFFTICFGLHRWSRTKTAPVLELSMQKQNVLSVYVRLLANSVYSLNTNSKMTSWVGLCTLSVSHSNLRSLDRKVSGLI